MTSSILMLLAANPVAGLAAKATLILAGALVLSRLARGAAASLRHLIAAAAFGVLLLLPLAALLAPARVVTIAPAAPPAAAAAAVAAPGAEPAGTPSARSTVPLAPGPAAPLRVAVAAAVYGAGVAWLGLSLLGGVWRLFRLGREAEVSVAGTRLANEMARAAGHREGIEVAVSPRLAVPITFGWGRPVIVLPGAVADWTDAELTRAVRHELEHIGRADWATHFVARLALAVYWPHPLAWMVWKRLRLEAERACDDAVVRAHGSPEPYAEQLVALARRLTGQGTVPALSMATRSNLGLRVEAILDAGRRRSPRSRRAALAAGVAGVVAALAVAPWQVIAAPQAVAQAAAGQGEGDDAQEAEDEDGDATPDHKLLEAAGRGNLSQMRRLLDEGARTNAALSGDGTPLLAAARGGHIEAMKMLLAEGADVNLGVGGDGNALLNAAREGHLEAVRLLLEHGADIDLGVPGDGNALIMAAGEGHADVVTYLLDEGAALEKVVPGDENPLIKACEAGRAAVVRLLIARGADVNARVWAERSSPDGQGEWRTPLVMARRGGHDEVVRILQAAGAKR